jgi:hypothetical protein
VKAGGSFRLVRSASPRHSRSKGRAHSDQTCLALTPIGVDSGVDSTAQRRTFEAGNPKQIAQSAL